jgi:hypothetical protein
VAIGDTLTQTGTYTGLPANNSDFGVKAAHLSGGPGSGVFAFFEVFYLKTETNHQIAGPYLGPTPPNWYVYWGQTSAGVSGGTMYYNGPIGSHYHFPGTNRILLGDDASKSQLAAWGSPKGIDCYAWAVRHELKHHHQLTGFWPTGWVSALDINGDMIPDAQEATYMPGRNYHARPDATFPYATYPDEFGYDPSKPEINNWEDINMRSQTAPYGLDLLWTNGSADAEDWANPGKNNKDKF